MCCNDWGYREGRSLGKVEGLRRNQQGGVLRQIDGFGCGYFRVLGGFLSG